MDIDSGNNLQILLKEKQDEIKKLNESGVISKAIDKERERTISYSKEVIKALETN